MNKRVILEDPIFKMDILVWRVIKLLMKSKRHTLEKFGLTCSQFDILSAIDYYSNIKTEIIQTNLSEKAEIDPMTTSTILRNLERKGLIRRNRGTVNTRIVIVELTDDGYELLEKAALQIKLSNKIIYNEIDKSWLTSQLMRLSDKLNKLDELNNKNN